LQGRTGTPVLPFLFYFEIKPVIVWTSDDRVLPYSPTDQHVLTVTVERQVLFDGIETGIFIALIFHEEIQRE
jgi:hypothetical protein